MNNPVIEACNPDGPLHALASFNQFVLWKLVHRPGKAKADKLLIDWRSGQPASSTNPGTWGSLDQIVTSQYLVDHHVGFVFTEQDPFFFLDIDGAWNAEANNWSDVALKLLGMTNQCAVEYSQSGHGFHIIGKCSPIEHSKKNTALGLEFYTSKRFVALTGNMVPGYGNADHEDDDAVKLIVPEYFPPKDHVASISGLTDAPRPGYNGIADDDALIEKLLNLEFNPHLFKNADKISFKALWERDLKMLGEKFPPDENSTKASPYDGSSADQSLANKLSYWTGGHGVRIERLMRRSALVRDKWDKHKTYLSDTIIEACNYVTNYPKREGSDFLTTLDGMKTGDALEHIYESGAYLATLSDKDYRLLRDDLGTRYGSDLGKVRMDEARKVAKRDAQKAEAANNLSKLAPGTVVINPKLHCTVAEMIHNQVFNGSFKVHAQDAYYYTGKNYEAYEGAMVESMIYRYLRSCADEKTGNILEPKHNMVKETYKALNFQNTISAKEELPFWLSGEGPNPENVIAFNNCLVDINDPHRITTCDHTSDWFDTCVRDFDYVPQASCPTWFKVLNEYFPGDAQAIEALQMMMGHLLTTDMNHQKIFMFEGPPRAGKGTIIRIIQKLVGENNYCAPSLNKMDKDFSLWPMLNKRVALIGDATMGNKTDRTQVLEYLKMISGNDAVEVNRKSQSILTTKLKVRFLISCNEIPQFIDASGALAARLIYFKFTNSFSGREDKQLDEKLERELPGIANWAIQGVAKLSMLDQFPQPESGREGVKELRETNNPVLRFLNAKCEKGGWVDKDFLYSKYVLWCQTEAQMRPINKVHFSRNLTKAYGWDIQPGRDQSKPGRPGTYKNCKYLAPELPAPTNL